MSDTKNPTITIDQTAVPVTIVRVPCLCGCGEIPTRNTAEFVPGHDAKLKALLIKAHLEGTSITITNGEVTREATALEIATERDWDGFLLVAERRATRKAAEKAERAAKAASSGI